MKYAVQKRPYLNRMLCGGGRVTETAQNMLQNYGANRMVQNWHLF
jgi:hypothetical protein